MKTFIWPVICILLIATSIFFYLQAGQKTAFFYNDKVFAAFQGKIELENKLKAEQARNKATLDSLAQLITTGRNELRGIYGQTEELSAMREQQLTEKYTSDIWKFINDQAAEYGKAHDYDFIFGAVGNGSLMYASEKNDVTAQFIEYLNTQYRKD